MKRIISSTEIKNSLILGVIVGAFLAGSLLFGQQTAEAAAPYEILYSFSSNRANPQPLDGAVIPADTDIWVFVKDMPSSVDSVVWKRNHLVSEDISRDSSDDSFTLISWGGPLYYSYITLAGDTSIRAITVENGEYADIMEATFSHSVGDQTLGNFHPDFKTTVTKNLYTRAYLLGGIDTSGALPEWKIEKRGHVNNDVKVTMNYSFGASAIELNSFYETQSFLFLGGAFQNGANMNPVVKSVHPDTFATNWTNNNVWGGGKAGSVKAVQAGRRDTSSNWPTYAWVAGYEMVGSDPHWAVTRLTNTGAIDGGGVWSQAAVDMAGNPIKGEALSLDYDLSYIYVGGYQVDGSGVKHGRIEKRDRNTGVLVAEAVLPGEGEILDVELEFLFGSQAIWAGGYEKQSATDKWMLQKLDLNLSTVGAPKVWNTGSVKDINIIGVDDLYVGGTAWDPPNGYVFKVENYDRNLSSKGDLLTDTFASGQATLSDIDLPFVVGWDESTGNGFVRGVKTISQEPECAAVVPAKDSARPERFTIDFSGFTFVTSDGLDTNNLANRLRGLERPVAQNPALPKGKYDVIQVSEDVKHSEEIEVTQNNENVVTYLFGSDPADVTDTGPSEDIPSDWLYKVTNNSSVTVPFDVVSTAVASYHYWSHPGTWDNKGVLSGWGGSQGEICTVLDRYPQCNDGLDNDGDGFCDTATAVCTDGSTPGDPDCTDPTDDDETGAGAPECSDGKDNDGDGNIDSADRQCHPSDWDATNPLSYDPNYDLEAYARACSLSAGPGDYLYELSLSDVERGVHPNLTYDRMLSPNPVDNFNLPAGTYKVTAESADPSHSFIPTPGSQPDEIWKVALFKNAGAGQITTEGQYNGQLVVESSVTSDLPDTVSYQVDVLDNALVVPDNITHISAVHGLAWGFPWYRSIHPLCVLFEPVAGPAVKPNIVEPMVQAVIPSTTFDPDTGFYTRATMRYSVQNAGAGTTTGPFDNEFISDFRINDVSLPPLTPSLNNSAINTVSNILDPGESSSIREVTIANDVPPGDYQVTITADYLDDIDEDDEGDNVRVVTGSTRNPADFAHLPAPDPNLTITATPRFVRYERTTRLDWTMDAWYPMECNIIGPGGTIKGTFDPSVSVPDRNGSVDTLEIKGKSEFIITCVEKISGYDEAFSASVIVETVGYVDEV